MDLCAFQGVKKFEFYKKYLNFAVNVLKGAANVELSVIIVNDKI